MTKKLQDLTEKIYNEGIQKAKEEADTIIKEAREKASAIEAEAKKKAEKTTAEAEEKAKETKKHVEAEMKMALDQSVAALKKEIIDLNVILHDSDKKEMENHFKKQLAHHLNKGLTLSFAKNIKSGFKVGPADGSYVISFSDEDFNNFFKAYLRPKSTELLFEKK
jgi:V/A-type H+-transporting ATPase subunit E